jgi:hypothetical protein
MTGVRRNVRGVNKLFLETADNLREMSKIQTVCVVCGRFKNEAGAWETGNAVADDVTLLSHGLCPACAEDFYSKYLDESSAAVEKSRKNAVNLGMTETR